jgi:hypothetical protein
MRLPDCHFPPKKVWPAALRAKNTRFFFFLAARSLTLGQRARQAAQWPPTLLKSRMETHSEQAGEMGHRIDFERAKETWDSDAVVALLAQMRSTFVAWRHAENDPAQSAQCASHKASVLALCEEIEARFKAAKVIEPPLWPTAQQDDAQSPAFVFLSAVAPSLPGWDIGQASTERLGSQTTSHPAVLAARWGGREAVEFMHRELRSPIVVLFEGASPCRVACLAAAGHAAGALPALVERCPTEKARRSAALSWLEGCLDWASNPGDAPGSQPDPLAVRDRLMEAKPWVRLFDAERRLPSAVGGVFPQTLEHAVFAFAVYTSSRFPDDASRRQRADLAARTLLAVLEVAPVELWPLSFDSYNVVDDGSPPDPAATLPPHGTWLAQADPAARCACEADPARRLMALCAHAGAWWAIEVLLDQGFPAPRAEALDAMNWSVSGACRDEPPAELGRWLYDPSRARSLIEDRLIRAVSSAPAERPAGAASDSAAEASTARRRVSSRI